MNKEFDDLNQRYQEANSSNDLSKKQELIEQMRANILERNEGVDEFIRSIDDKKYSIKDASYKDLLEINGAMNNKDKTEELASISNTLRSEQTERNIYGEKNPYTS